MLRSFEDLVLFIFTAKCVQVVQLQNYYHCTNVNHGRLLQQVLQSAKKKPISTDSGSL